MVERDQDLEFGGKLSSEIDLPQHTTWATFQEILIWVCTKKQQCIHAILDGRNLYICLALYRSWSPVL